MGVVQNKGAQSDDSESLRMATALPLTTQSLPLMSLHRYML